MEFSGIYIKNNQVPLIFLEIGEKRTGELLSSLQAFETSLLMIGMGRWTNAIINISNAIELITRHKFPEEHLFKNQIKNFCNYYKLSDSIIDAARVTRKKRNDYVHQSIIPEDNEDAIVTFLAKALSVYKVFLQSEFKYNIYDLIVSNCLRENLIIARDLAKKINNDIIPLEEKAFGYKMCVLVKTISNLNHTAFTPRAMYYAAEDDTWHNWDNYLKMQEIYEEGCEGDVLLHQNENDYLLKCPAECNSFLSLEVASDDEEKLKKSVFNSAMCCNCGLFIIPEELLSIYVRKRLGEDKINKLLKSYGH